MKMLLWALAFSMLSGAQETIVLRPDAATGIADKVEERGSAQVPDRAVSAVHDPSLTIYLPERSRANGYGILICPGGGYVRLAIDKEGHDIARWLQGQGYAAFVLKYRLLSEGMKGTMDTLEQANFAARQPIDDALGAMRIVRANSTKWNLKPAGIGMMGFSAGGHLAFVTALAAERNERPDFLVLGYPALPKTYTIGANFPPTFMVHADDDRLAAAAHSVPLYLALKRAGVSAELHVFSSGGHGFGMRQNKATASAWPGALKTWLGELAARP